jgi:hypothetical protein
LESAVGERVVQILDLINKHDLTLKVQVIIDRLHFESKGLQSYKLPHQENASLTQVWHGEMWQGFMNQIENSFLADGWLQSVNQQSFLKYRSSKVTAKRIY